jgi:hypothetical protein
MHAAWKHLQIQIQIQNNFIYIYSTQNISMIDYRYSMHPMIPL